jgi:hypothetical protein
MTRGQRVNVDVHLVLFLAPLVPCFSVDDGLNAVADEAEAPGDHDNLEMTSAENLNTLLADSSLWDLFGSILSYCFVIKKQEK